MRGHTMNLKLVTLIYMHLAVTYVIIWLSVINCFGFK
jgi:hypothetical protein